MGGFAPPFLAVGEGFEPPIPLRVYRISNAAHSTTLASHQTFERAGFEITPFNRSGMSPFLVDPGGIGPPTPPCHGGVLPVYYGPIIRGRISNSPSLLLSRQESLPLSSSLFHLPLRQKSLLKLGRENQC